LIQDSSRKTAQMNKELKIKNKTFRTVHKALKAFGRAWNLTVGLVLKKFLNLISYIVNRILMLLPRRWRVKIHNLQHKFKNYRVIKEHKRASIGLVAILIAVPIMVGTLAYIQQRNNERFATDLPYQEKIAEGAWKLHNMDQKPQLISDGSTGTDLNLKEVMNVGDFVRPNSAEASSGERDITRPFDTLRYKWMVKLFSGTYFEFGGVSKDTPEGKVLPVVRVRNREGAYVAFMPRSMNQESGVKAVAPKVEGNVISWEIAPGITARYTMMEDRVKADYIVKDQVSYTKYDLSFDLEYGGGELLLDPNGNLLLNKQNYVDGSGEIREMFTIPIPVITDAEGIDFEGTYGLNENQSIQQTQDPGLEQIQDGKATLGIILPPDELSKAKFPLIVDPIIIDSSVQGSILEYGNARSMMEDAWGNLLLVTGGWNQTNNRDHVWYKNYDSNDWIDANVDLAGSDDGYCRPQRIAADIDSSGDVHVAAYFSETQGLCTIAKGKIGGYTFYSRLNVLRDVSNKITNVNVSDFQEIDQANDDSGGGYNSRPSIIVANKGTGEGKEKVIVTYTTPDPRTDRTETRIMQKDVWNVGYEDMILGDSNLVGYWRMGERYASNSAVDISPTRNNNSSTYGGTPLTQASPAAILGDSENTAWRFNGSTDYVSIADNDAYSPVTTTKLTVEAWVKPTGGTDGDYVISKGNSTNDWEWSIQRYNSGGSTGFQAHLRNTAGTSIAQANVLGAGYAPDDQWHYVVMTVDTSAQELYLYLNDEYSGSDASWLGTMSNGADDLRLGYRDGSAYLEGELDEVTIYSDILIASEITEHFDKGRESYYSNVIKATPGLEGYWRLGTPSGTIAHDDSGNNNNGVYTNSPTLGASGATGIDWDRAVSFAGTNDYVNVSGMSVTAAPLSYEVWVKDTNFSDEGLISSSTNGSAGSLLYGSTTDRISLLLNSTVLTYDTNGAVNDGRWHHVVGTWDGSVMKLFYDGRLVAGPIPFSEALTGTGSVKIGQYGLPTGSENDGSYDEAAIYSVALTEEQVMEHYQAANDWKNVSEEISSNASALENCRDTATRGEAGFATDTYCSGVTDVLFSGGGYESWSHAEVNQFPGTPARTPDSVKWDDNGSFSNLTNTYDGNRTTTSSINGFTTADYIYIGDDKPFSKVTVDMFATNSATADFAITDIEYCSLSYDGTTCTTWSDLSNFYDYTDNATSAFSEDGSLLFDEPDNWATVTVNSTTGKYWIRIRPDAAFDSDVKIAEITVNNRNSNALIVIGGSNPTEGLQPTMIPWDDITNDTWENRADNPGDPWYQFGYNVNGFGWDTPDNTVTVSVGFCNEAVLNTAMDYKNNQFYTFFKYDPGDCDNKEIWGYVYTVGNNKDVLDIENWTNTGFPLRGGDNLAFSALHTSMSFDGNNIWMFLNPDANDSSTQSAYLMRCTPHAARDPKKCDSSADWGGYAKTVLENNKIANADERPEAVKIYSSSIDSDTTELNLFWGGQGNGNMMYDRVYVDLNDKKVIGAVSADDAFHRDCDTGTDDQDIGSIVVKLGREDADGSCDSSADSENHAGFRFQNVDVAPGAKISSAYIDFKVASRSGTTAIDFNIYGEDADNSSAYSAQSGCTAPCTGNVGERTVTTSTYSQSIDFEEGTVTSNEGVGYRFDVTDIVQEIVCRGVIGVQPCVGDFNGSGAWASGNSLSIILESIEGGNSDNWINIFGYDDTQGLLEPTLHINCGDSCDEPKPQEAEWCDLGGVNGNGSNDCNNNWQSRKKITFDNRASSENLTEFPALIRLDSTKIDYSKVQNAGQDLRFVDATGGAVLRYDIDEWNESGESLVWVRVPQIDAGSNTDYVYMYYNNASASAGMNENETYESNIELVAHLHEDPTSTCSGTDELCDSSSNNYHMDSAGTGWASGDSVNGVIGSAIDFNGTDQNFARTGTDGISALPGGNNARTMEGWFRTTNNDALSRAILGYGHGTGAEDINMMLYTGNFEIKIRNTANAFTGLKWNDGEWHYGVITYDGTNFLAYMDGEPLGSPYDPSTNPNTDVSSGDADSSEVLYIGRYSNWHEGSLDEIRIHTGARSADYIEASYLNAKPDSTFVSIASEETDPTVSDYEALIKAEPDLVGYWRLGEPANYTQFIESLNPTAYWPMDEASGDFSDASENGFTATSNGPPAYQQTGPTINGQVQSAVLFDEDKSPTQYATFSNTIDDSVTTSTGMTISVWFKIPPSGATSDPIVTQGETNLASWVVTTDSGGAVVLYAKQTDGASNYCWAGDDSINYDDDQWHHIVGWIDSSANVHAIVDGGTIHTNSCGTPVGTWNAETDSDGAIGAYSSSGATPSDVSVAHVAYWDYDIGDAIQAGLYDAKTAFDDSSTANHGTYHDSPTLGISGAIGIDNDTAVTFDGSTDNNFTAPDNAAYDFGTGDYSLEAWIKRTAVPGSSEFIVAHDGEGYPSNWDLWVDSGTDILKARIGVTGYTAVSYDISDDRWHHVVFTADRDGNGTFYIDGEVNNIVDISGTSSTDLTNTDLLYVADRPTAGNEWTGSIDEVAIYKGRVLSAADVANHYAVGRASLYANTVTDTTGLVGYWRLGEGGGTVAEDLSGNGHDGTYTSSPTLGATGAIKGDNDTAVDFVANSYVQLTDHADFDTGDGPLTVEAWVKRVTIGGTGDVWSKGTQGNMLFESGTNKMRVGNESGAVVNETGSTTDTNWHHWLFTHNGAGTTKLYKDGVDVTNPGTLGALTANAVNPRIGAWFSDLSEDVLAIIDEVAVYNVVLTDEQIIERYLAGGGTNKYNLRQFSKGVSTATGSASFSDLDSRFSSADYIAVQGDDETYVDVSADVNVSRDADALPAYMLKVNNGRGSNKDIINATAVVKSSTPTTSNPIYLQIYRAGTTDNWVTIATDNSSKADTDITLSGISIQDNASEYYINETSGVGTQGVECTDGTSNCWAYFRVYQDGGEDNYNTILSLDAFDASFEELGPTQISFTNEHRYIATNVCSGASNPFNIELQNSSGTATAPVLPTTVRVTSNTGGTLTIYSDSACINPVSNGDFLFTTSDTSKTFYIKDNGISNDYQLTATVLSGDTLTNATTFYTIEGGLRLDSRTRIKGGGDTRIRGGTRFR